MSDVSPISSVTPYQQTAAQPALTGGRGSTDPAKNIDAVSQDFEAVFLSQMLSSMFSGEEFTSFFGGGTSGDIYKSFMMNEYGKVLAQSGGIGIASQVKQELLKLQEITS